jgi:hypothetical protein
MEADGAARADGAGGEYKMSEAVKAVRTCQNWVELVWGYFCCMWDLMVTDLGVRHLWNITPLKLLGAPSLNACEAFGMVFTGSTMGFGVNDGGSMFFISLLLSIV